MVKTNKRLSSDQTNNSHGRYFAWVLDIKTCCPLVNGKFLRRSNQSLSPRMCSICSTNGQLSVIRRPECGPETQLHVYTISIKILIRMDSKMTSKLANRAVINAFSQPDHV